MVDSNVARVVASFSITSGPTANYRTGRRPRGVAGGHESTNYVVMRGADFATKNRGDILLRPSKGKILKFAAMLAPC